MKRSVWMVGMLLAMGGTTGLAEEFDIQSFDGTGRLTFNEVTTAVTYRVEWAPSPGGPWTNTWESLATIAAKGSGIVTCSVPMCYRVVATVTPPNMALIPEGSFVMGNATNVFAASEGIDGELPQHTVVVSAFDMDKYEVTKALWDEVTAYNGGNGYEYSNPGSGNDANHPVDTVNWFDVVKWCNARSQCNGLTPVYYTDEGFTTVYKTDEIIPFANWAANGFRLPTEAEWEKAARGGVADTRFPWADYTNRTSHAKANYYGDSGTFSYDLSSGPHPTYGGSASPVGSFAPNGYGLYDMAGNVGEWCWDRYDISYYSSSPATDPRGPTNGVSRVLRGGSWPNDARWLRCSARENRDPDFENVIYGFRCARGR